jgi:hypothetical protein
MGLKERAMARKAIKIWICGHLTALSQLGLAVEAGHGDHGGVKDRWGVVGVISESDPGRPNKGVAVLKHLISGKTYTP